MKRNYLLILLIATLISCQKENDSSPIKAVFSLNDSLVRINQYIEITNKSDSDNISYLWDFGDGNTSIERNPLHFYNNSGKFEIKLTISNKNGITDSYCKTITVGEMYVYEVILKDFRTNKWFEETSIWDQDSSELKGLPDVFIKIVRDGEIYKTNPIFNLSPSSLPLSIPIPNIKIQPLEIALGENGIFIYDYDDIETSETMMSNRSMGAFLSIEYDKTSHTGIYSVSFAGGFALKFKVE